MKKKEFLRIAQLDLARQMETVPFIKKFIDLLAQFNYNALFLYVEWRVRTKAFDIGKEEGYSPEELKEIISYAAKKKIMIIPGFATLGHAELLLKSEKFAYLSELREGIEGRFGKTFSPDFCPSLPETRKFLSEYLEEASVIFSTSPYFHVGGDEVWDLGFCSECKKKAKNFAGEQKLYLDHFLFIYELLKKLNKKMMFWDDMFEYYPEILPEMPRDVVMVNWQYHDNVKGYSGHLRNMYFEDRLALYEKLGFRYIPAPADYSWYNVSSITEYGRKYNCAGFMLTAWEKQPSLMYKYFINTAMAGEFWSDLSSSADDAGKKALKKLFGVKDEAFLDAVLAYAGIARRIPNVSINSLTSFPLSGPGNTRYYFLKAFFGVLAGLEGKMKDERGNLILKDILYDCQLKILEDRSVRAAWRIWQAMECENISTLCKEVEKAGKEYAFFYTQHRREKDSLTFCNMISTWVKSLKEIKEKAEKNCYLKVLFAQSDQFGVEKVHFYLDGKEISSGVYKNLASPYYEKYIILPEIKKACEIKISAHGYGGQGIAFLTLYTGKDSYVPAAVKEVKGIIEHPEYILSPDVNRAYFGNADVEECFKDRSKAESIHSMTITLKKAKI